MSQPHAAHSQTPVQHPGKLPERVEQVLNKAVTEMRFGVVQLTVHDGKVVQLDITERQRF